MSAALDLMTALVIEDGRRWGEAAERVQLEDARAFLIGSPPYHFVTRARGYSKTSDLAGAAATLLLTLPAGARLYWLAADAEQGTLALDSIAGYERRTPLLRGQLTVQARRVVVPSTGSTLDVLAADAPSAWGLRPAAVLVDELAQWPESRSATRLLEAVTSAVLKVPGARLAVITTAGDPAHPAARLLEHARESSLWRVSETAGPPPWVDPARLAEQRRRLPESAFARLFENVWCEAEDRLTTVEAVRECVTHAGPLEYDRAHKYVVALDLGLKRDRTAAVVAHREGERVLLDRLAVWQGSRLRPVRLADVEEWIEHAAGSYGRANVVCDPWQTIGLAQRLRGRGLRVEEFAFTAQSVGRLAGTLFNLLRDRALGLPDDAGLLDELAHVRLRETSPGVLRLDHDSGRNDDRAVAVALAATHLLRERAHGRAEVGPVVWDGSLIVERSARAVHGVAGHESWSKSHFCRECHELRGDPAHNPPLTPRLWG